MGKVSAKQIRSAAPSSVGTSNQRGTSDAVALADHVHDHGQQTGGNLHAVASAVAPGFMSAIDKAALDELIATGGGNGAPLATVPPAAVGTTAVTGTSSEAAHADHVHAHGAQTDATLHAVATGSAAGFMSSGDKTAHDAAVSKLAGIPANADNTAAALAAAAAAVSINGQKLMNVGTPAAASDAANKGYVDSSVAATLALDTTGTPAALGTAARGSAATAAHADHVHAHGAQTDGTHHAAASTSVAGFMSASDKTKLDGVATGATATPLATVAPVAVAATAALGTSTKAAKEDHVHAHGAQTDGTHHAAATTSVAGFMSAQDKTDLGAATTKLAGIPANADNTATALAAASASVSVNGQKIANVATPGAASDAATKGYVDSATSGLSTVQLDAAGTPANIGTAARGSATTAAHSDHVHAHGSQTDPAHHALASGSANGFMSAADKLKLDGVATGATALALASAVTGPTPAEVNIDSEVGASNVAARSDHIHAHGSLVGGTLHALANTNTAGFMSAADKTKLDGMATGATAVQLASGVSGPTPANVAALADVGSSALAARADHVHPHGSQTDGTMHAAATTAAAGFMSATDKTLLDQLALKSVYTINGGVATANVDLTSASTVQVDGVNAANGFTYLLTAQTNAAENGLYTAGTSGRGNTFVRSQVTTAAGFMRPFFVHAPSVSYPGNEGGTLWTNNPPAGAVTLGTTALSFSRASARAVNALTTMNPGVLTGGSSGSLATWARADHYHPHGNIAAGSTLHAAADGTNNGFMSATHYTRLETLKTGVASSLGRVTVEALYQTATANNAATGALSLDVSTKNDFTLFLTGNVTLTLTNGANGMQGNIWVKQDTTGNRTLSITATGATRMTEKAAASITPQAEASTVTHYSYCFVTINGTLYFMLYRTFLETI